MFEIAQFFVDNPKQTRYKGYTVLGINKVGSITKVTLRNLKGEQFVVTLPMPESWK